MAIGIKKSKYLILLKYLAFFTLFFVVHRANVGELLFPFSFGVFLGLVWCNQNVIALSVGYLISGYLANFSLFSLLGDSAFCLIFALIFLIHYKTKKPIKYINLLIYACICSAPKIFIDIYFVGANIYVVFAEFLIGLLFAFVCIKFFEAVCIRGICNRFTTIEVICGICLVATLSAGMLGLRIFDFYLIKLVGVLFLLLTSYITSPTIAVLMSAGIGLGTLFASGSTKFFAIFMIYGLTISAFKTKNRYITVVALCASECVLGLYFKMLGEFTVLSALPILLASLAYLVIPSKYIDRLGSEFTESLSSMTQQSVINRNREMLHYRLVELSDVFMEMNKVYRGMICGGIVNDDAKKLMLRELKLKNCKDCPSQGKCYKIFGGETYGALGSLIDCGFEKGKVNLLDVPTAFAGKCEKLNGVVSSINDLISQYKNYAGLVNNIDASKVLLADQLAGVGEIMHDLSKEVSRGVSFERGKEKKIIDELTYNNIICSDALVFEDRDSVLSVTLSLKKADAGKSSIAKVVSKVCGQRMEVADESSSTRAGWEILSLKSAPKYDVIFGIASRTKTGSIKSGDCYSVIKIKDGKYLFALCDGMGSGEFAEQTSSTAIGLVENFYKAGFDKGIILSSVNKLLSLGKDDVFSALDLCIVDTRDGIGDFIKMGAPESYIKHRDTTDQIEIGALPLGIVQNAECRARQVYLTSGDKIVLVTDGISDAFASAEALQDYINNLNSTNPQTIADEIISKVLELSKNVARDDMSVIVAKIFER